MDTLFPVMMILFSMAAVLLILGRWPEMPELLRRSMVAFVDAIVYGWRRH